MGRAGIWWPVTQNNRNSANRNSANSAVRDCSLLLYVPVVLSLGLGFALLRNSRAIDGKKLEK